MIRLDVPVNKETAGEVELKVAYFLCGWWAIHKTESVPLSDLMSFLYTFCTLSGTHTYLGTDYWVTGRGLTCRMFTRTMKKLEAKKVIAVIDGQVHILDQGYFTQLTCEKFNGSIVDSMNAIYVDVFLSIALPTISDIALLWFLENTFIGAFGSMDSGTKRRLLTHYRDIPFTNKMITHMDTVIHTLRGW